MAQTAYAAESIVAKENTYHKSCFKCFSCSTRLTLTTYKVCEMGGMSNISVLACRCDGISIHMMRRP